MPGNNAAYSDAAKHCSDQIQLGLITGNVGRWVAIKLESGKSDGVFYDSRADAIEHQLHESLCCYVKIPPTGMPVQDAERFMIMNRMFYDAGFRLTDPSDERQPLMPHTQEDFIRHVSVYLRNKK